MNVQTSCADVQIIGILMELFQTQTHQIFTCMTWPPLAMSDPVMAVVKLACRLCLKGSNTDRAQWCNREKHAKKGGRKMEWIYVCMQAQQITTAFGILWKLCVAMTLGDIIRKEWVNNCWWGWQNRTTLEKCPHLYNETQETMKHKRFRHLTKLSVESACV